MTRAQREDLEHTFVENASAATRLFERFPTARLTRRPADTSWSAAECVVHLTLTAAATAPLLEAAVADLALRGAVSRGPSRMDWLGRMLRWSLEPPPRFKTRTTTPFEPLRVEPLSHVLPGYLEEHARLVRILRSAEGLDLAAARITSPFNDRVKYNAFACFRILETHDRRHLWQAERAAGTAA